jgi:vitamin B12 transporter
VPAWSRRDFATVGATYFNSQIRDLIQTEFTPVYTAVNIGAAHIQGVESEIALRPADWLSADLAYTYTDARDADAGTALLRRPKHSVSLTATLKPTEKLTIAPELLYAGTFHDFLIDNAGVATADVVSTRAGFLLNLTVTYQLLPQLALFATGRNLTDTRFEPVNGYRTQPTWFLAGVRVKL